VLSARVVRRAVLQKFLSRVLAETKPCERLLIVSPWITAMRGQKYPLDRVLGLLPPSAFISVVTRQPGFASHEEAVQIVAMHRNSEIIYNDSIHAKIYVATFDRDRRKIALIGSANLTSRGNTQGEIGIIFVYSMEGKRIINDLEREIHVIRTMRQGKRVKRWGESAPSTDLLDRK